MRLIHKNQRGFTLIELLVALAITGAIAGGITTAIFQVFNINTLSNNHMLAVRQVQNAGHFISHDTQMAQSIVLGDDEGPPEGTPETEVLTLSWVGWTYDYGNNTRTNTYEVYYTYDDTNNKLWRHEKITTAEYESDGDLADPQPADQNSTTFIADYITSAPTITLVGGKITLTLTATVGNAEETRTYEITPRPST